MLVAVAPRKRTDDRTIEVCGGSLKAKWRSTLGRLGQFPPAYFDIRILGQLPPSDLSFGDAFEAGPL